MEPKLDEQIAQVANVLHWVGKYRECNALILFGRLLRRFGIENLEQLQKYVDLQEAER